MRKATSFFAALTAAAILCTSTMAAEKKGLVVFGDSITTGFGLEGYSAGDNESAAESFSNLLSADYEVYANYAADGLNTTQLLSTFTSADLTDMTALAAAASLSTADTAVISIGGNDLLQVLLMAMGNAVIANAEIIASLGVEVDTSSPMTIFQTLSAVMAVDTDGVFMAALQESIISQSDAYITAGTAAATNIGTILTAIFGMNPDIDLFILSIYNPFSGVPQMEDISAIADTVLASLNGAISAQAATAASAGFSATFVDYTEAFSGNGLLLTNMAKMDIHPNAAGHQTIYAALSEAIDEAKGISEEPEITVDDDEPEDVAVTVEDVDVAQEEDAETTAEDVTDTADSNTDKAVNEAPTPDTGAESVAIVVGLALAATGLIIVTRKRR